ncbi:MAG: hypothetical protein EA401_07270 [Planctomycetota bacterium]|nr:MAG: hypothetical protein EA401_07270 [Planctomycetota bacterium]
MTQHQQHPPSTRTIRRTTALPLRIALVLILAAVAATVWILGPTSLSDLIAPRGEASANP